MDLIALLRIRTEPARAHEFSVDEDNLAMPFSDELNHAYSEACPPPMIEPGWYYVRVVAATECVAGTGTQGLRIELAIVRGAMSGLTHHHTFWLTAKSLPFVKINLGVLGLGDESLNDLVARQSFADAPVAAVRLGYTEFNGRRRIDALEFCQAPDEHEGTQPAAQDGSGS